MHASTRRPAGRRRAAALLLAATGAALAIAPPARAQRCSVSGGIVEGSGANPSVIARVRNDGASAYARAIVTDLVIHPPSPGPSSVDGATDVPLWSASNGGRRQDSFAGMAARFDGDSELTTRVMRLPVDTPITLDWELSVSSQTCRGPDAATGGMPASARRPARTRWGRT